MAHSQPKASSLQITSSRMLVAYISGAYGFSFANTMGFLVPLRALELGAPAGLIGIIAGAAAILPPFTSIPAGALSDRIGPRQAYIIGTSISGVIALAFALTSNLWVMLALQLLLGPARTLAWVSSQTYITGIGSPEERPSITAKFSFSTQVGVLISPALAGAAAALVGYQASFVLAVVLAGLFVLMGLIIPDIRSRPQSQSSANTSAIGFSEAIQLLKLRGIQVVLLLTWMRVWTTSGWTAFFPILLIQQGFSPSIAGTVVSSWALVAMVSTLGAGRASRLGSKEMIIATTLVLGALGVAISTYVSSFPLIYLPALLIGIGQGLSLPLLLAAVSDYSPPEMRGVALGIRVSVNQTAATLSPISMGGLINLSGNAVGFVASGAFMAAVLAVASMLHLNHRRKL